MRGRLVVLEGGEGCGKSTQARLLADARGAVLTSEPGATALGARIRGLVLDPAAAGLDPRAEALLVVADRAQHVAEVLRPALEEGLDVVCDRFTPSTLAYQGYGRGLDVEFLRSVSAWAAGGLEPDLVVLLEVPPAEARARMGGRPDRLEAEGDRFHHRVADGYRALAAADGRWVVVDGGGGVDEVADRVRRAVEARLGPPVWEAGADG